MNTLTTHLSPLRDYSVEDLMKIVVEKHGVDLKSGENPKDKALKSYATFDIMLRNLERIKAMPLTKEMFVVETSDIPANWASKGVEDLYAIRAKQVLFEGFENATTGVKCGNVYMWLHENTLVHQPFLHNFVKLQNIICIGDLIHEIARYNRTATNKIEIKVTENFVKMMIQ